MPEKVDDCVESVLEDNPDYSESRAYAICNAEMNAGDDVTDIEVESLADLDVTADELDALADDSADWQAHDTDAGRVWTDGAGAAVYQADEQQQDGDTEQQARVSGDAVVVEGLSAEALASITETYNVDIHTRDD